MQGIRSCFTSLGISLSIAMTCMSAASADDAPKALRPVATPLQAVEKTRLSSELGQYFGANRASYLPAAGSTYDQFSSVIFANANRQTLGDGDVLITSIDASNTKVRASVLLGPDGDIKGAALIHYDCKADKGGSFACADDLHPTMTIFLRTYDSGDQLTNTFVIGKFRKWANTSINRMWGKNSPRPVDVRVQVQRLHTAAPTVG